MKISRSDALIVVDVQNDFCPGGALAVPGGDGVVRPINTIMQRFDHIIFTRDWHPSDHGEFSDTPEFKQGSWPPHCVEHTPGAEFNSDLIVPMDAVVISKENKERETYSGFVETDLEATLRQWGIGRVFVGGLATDYCVKMTAMDAKKLGFEVVLLSNACRALTDESGAAALAEMQGAGILIAQTGELQ